MQTAICSWIINGDSAFGRRSFDTIDIARSGAIMVARRASAVGAVKTLCTVT